MGKPTLDLLIFTTQLSRSLGALGTVGLFANYFFTAWILRKATPAFGQMKTMEASLEAEYRAGVAKIGRDGEEIAWVVLQSCLIRRAGATLTGLLGGKRERRFYQGGPRERQILWAAYNKLIKHVNDVFKVRIAYKWVLCPLPTHDPALF
jgi:ATP-binding cassette subfamily D (ALD) long-chain fatty acid import protein